MSSSTVECDHEWEELSSEPGNFRFSVCCHCNYFQRIDLVSGEITIDPPDEPIPEFCGSCHEPALYHKIDAGYPGLYHCAACGVWIDRKTGESWRVKIGESDDDEPTA